MLNKEQIHGFLTSKFGGDVIWNIGSLGVLAVGGLLINFVVIAIRDEAALGVFNQVYAIYIVLSQFAVGGIQHSVLRLVSYYQDDRTTSMEITTSALIFVAITGLLVCGVGALLVKPSAAILDSPSVGEGLLFSLPGLFFFSLNKVLINALNGLRHMRPYAIFRSARFVFIPLTVLLICLSPYEDSYLTFAFTISEFLLFIGLLAFVYFCLFSLRVKIDYSRWFSEHLSFGIRGFFSGVLLELNTRVDVLMLGYFSTDAAVGVYSFAAVLAEGISQLPLAVRWNVDPIIGQRLVNKQYAQISDFTRKIRRVMHPAMLGVGLIAIAVYPVVIRLLVPDLPLIQSLVVFFIIVVGVMFNGGYRPFGGILLQDGRAGTYTLFVLALVLNDALLNLVFIPLLGIYGAALVTMITYFLEALGLVLITKRLFNIRL